MTKKSTELVNEASAFYQSMQMSNALAHQQAMQSLQLATYSKVASLVMSGSIGAGGADIATMMELLKSLQVPPPK